MVIEKAASRVEPAPQEVRRVAWFLLGLVAFGVATAVVITIITNAWVSIIRHGVLAMWASYLVFPALALWLNHRGRSLWAVRVLIGGLILVMSGVEFRLASFGLVQGLGLFLITAFVVVQTRVPSRQAVQLVVTSAVVGTILFLLDTFAPAAETTSTEYSSLINSLIVAAVVGLGLFALRRWSDFRLPTKLVVNSVVVGVISVAAVSISTGAIVQGSLMRDAGANLRALAVNKAGGIATVLDRESDLLGLLAQNQLMQTSAEAENLRYVGDPAAVDTRLRELDRAWKASPPAEAPVQTLLTNDASRELGRFAQQFPENLSVLLTDKHGGLVASTYPVANFDQRDEEWWKRARGGSEAAGFISQPEYWPEFKRNAVVIAVPLRDRTSAVIGVLQAVYDVGGLAGQLVLNREGASDSSYLIFPSGQILRPDGDMRSIDPGDRATLQALPAGQSAQLSFLGSDVIVSRVPVASPAGEGRPDIRALGWSIVTAQSPAIALQTVRASEQASRVASVLALLLVGLLSLAGGQVLARPIIRLTKVTEEVAEGNLSVQAPAESSDEIGALARTFNRMTGQLRQTLETLEQRVADRTAGLARATDELRRNTASLQTSAEISRAIASTLKLEELLPLVTRMMGDRFAVTHVGIYLLDKEGKDAVLRAAYGETTPGSLLPGDCVPVGPDTAVGRAIEQGEWQLARDASRTGLVHDNGDASETSAQLTLPLRAGGQMIGALDVHSPLPGGFPEADVSVLMGLADQVAIAIQNARSYELQVALAEENRRSLERQTALAEENRRSAERQSTLAEENRRLLERSQRVVRELDALAKRLTGEAWDSFMTDRSRPLVVVEEDSTVDNGNHHGLPLELDRAEKGQVVRSQNGNSLLALPITLRGQVIGSVALEDADSSREWQPDDVGLMQEVAEQLALALDNARLYRQVEEELDERRRAESVVRRQNVYLNALAETSVGLVQRLDPRALVEDILDRASQLVGTENGYVYLLDPQAGEIEMRIGTGVYASLIGSRLKPGTGLAGTVWQTGQPLVLDDYRQWPHRLPSASRDVLRAVTGVPL
ncbi:MAG: GAF domain-containing protein, partial [Rudaea sp.]